MNTIVLSSAALGVATAGTACCMATARSTQRPTARGFHGVAGGRSQLRIVAQCVSPCSAVAAASSSIGASIQEAAAPAKPAACKALLCLGAAWNSWAAQPIWLAVAAVMALAAVKALQNLSKQDFADLCEHEQAVRQLGGEQVWMPLLALCLRFACSALGAGDLLRRRQLWAAQLTTYHTALCSLLLQPAALMAELHRTTRKLGRRVAAYAISIGAAYLVQYALFGAADELLHTVARLCLECMAYVDTAKWIWVFCIAQQGKASKGGQQPSMP